MWCASHLTKFNLLPVGEISKVLSEGECTINTALNYIWQGHYTS